MKKSLKLAAVLIFFALYFSIIPVHKVGATPFFSLEPKKQVLRGEFSTVYKSSSFERKHNIELCAKLLDNAVIPPFEDFSFNKKVGQRSASRGFLTAKIIVGGEFTDGVGGGVCQVSTTLYNALLLADIDIKEVHQHSLSVSYVEPSFDAMVNGIYADLRAYNQTKNPIIIKASADGERIKISVFGEEKKYKIKREYLVKSEIDYKRILVFDEKNEYNLIGEEEKIITYGKKGKKTEGYIRKTDNFGKTVEYKLIRKNTYLPINEKIVVGVKNEK